MRKFRPIGKRVLLDFPLLSERIEKGIIIPEATAEHTVDGYWLECHAVGEKCFDVKKGDTVFLPRFSGHQVEHLGKLCLVTKENDIDAKMVD